MHTEWDEQVRLSFAGSSVRTARRLVTGQLEARGVPLHLVELANLVIGELVANGVWHGRPLPGDEVEFSWTLDDTRLVVSVLDGGHVEGLQARMPGPEAPGGRGLGMIDLVCARWSYDGTDGTRVTAELSLEGPGPPGP